MPLAQTTATSSPATTTAATIIETVTSTGPAWHLHASDFTRAVGIFAATAVVFILILLPLRGFLRRTLLVVPYLVFALTASIVHGIMTLPGPNGEPVLHSDNVVSYWTIRVFAAVLVYLGLRIFDRLMLVPFLTRGGKALPRFLHQIINIVLILVATFVFGWLAFGWDIDKFLAGSAVVSIVLGLALQESLGNFFSGLVIQASPPFALGHRIKCAGFEGDVVDMNWRAVTLQTDEDDYIIIPNANVAKSEVINYSIPTRATARFVRVGLEYDLPPADALAVLKQAALETSDVLHKPEPIVYLEKFADSAVEYSVKFWIENAGEHEIISHRLRIHIWYRLKERGYNIPYPVRTVEHSSHAAKSRQLREAAMTHRQHAMAGVPLLAPLSAEQRRQLAEVAGELFLTTGQILFRQNDTGDSFYIIYKGEVDVIVTPPGSQEERIVARLKAGDFFGEMSALTGQPRTATIRAAAPLACVQIEKRDLLPIFERDPALMERISEIVAKRNAEREAILQGPGKSPEPDSLKKNQKTLLVRMMTFFGLSQAA